MPAMVCSMSWEQRQTHQHSQRHNSSFLGFFLGTYPAVDLNIDGVQVAVRSANIDELDEWPNTDALQINIDT